MRTLVLVMPVFNEGDGLITTLQDLQSHLPNDIHLIIVDDCSKDLSKEVAYKFSVENRFPITIIQNRQNIGHGPSVIKGLIAALEIFPVDSFILSLDGDGQVSSVELQKLLAHLEDVDFDVIVGIRTKRQDDTYRKFISLFARLNLFLSTGVRSKDANTPIRIWKSEVLLQVLPQLPSNMLLVPNIFLTKLIARNSLQVQEIEIEQAIRNGDSKIGVSWSNRWSFLPSKRLVRFAVRAFVEQWRTK